MFWRNFGVGLCFGVFLWFLGVYIFTKCKIENFIFYKIYIRHFRCLLPAGGGVKNLRL